MRKMNKKIFLYYILVGLVFIDIIITIYAVKYLGGYELNPFCINFNTFIEYKCVLSSVCLIIIYFFKDYKYWEIFMYLWISIYGLVFISNLWVTVNYLYY